MSVLPTEDLVGAAAEEILAQLKTVPLIRERVFRYLPQSAQKRIAGRIASATLAKVFQRAATLLSLPELRHGDYAIDLLPDRGSRFPSRGRYVRYCHGCGANRPTHYSSDRIALVCMKCGRPTSPMREEATGDTQAPKSADRLAG